MARWPGGAVERPEREEAFQALAGTTRLDRAYGLALHVVGNAADAEDACQEALLAAWAAWPRLRDRGRFDAWFDRILLNTCLEHLRRRGRRPQLALPEEPGIAEGDVLAGTVERDVMARALARLTPEQRVTVVLRFWADLPTDAIAERPVPGGQRGQRGHRILPTAPVGE